MSCSSLQTYKEQIRELVLMSLILFSQTMVKIFKVLELVCCSLFMVKTAINAAVGA